MTAYLAGERIARQLTEACGWSEPPRYVIRDRDGAREDRACCSPCQSWVDYIIGMSESEISDRDTNFLTADPSVQRRRASVGQQLLQLSVSLSGPFRRLASDTSGRPYLAFQA